MTVTDFLLPVFVEVFLIFVLMAFMGVHRSRSLTSGEIKLEDVALDNTNYPARAKQFANSFNNQFELPMLFFVLIGFILITRVGDILLLILVWIFVVSRLLHAYVHTTSNNVDWRFRAYALGCVALFTMWAVFAFKILTAA
ncbi:MAPEG family protein [Hyphomicrobium sp.]|jgi:hypothetical protein|uniref:MAPEG family protein n=1 Tax=Hyphomicrobium sp. TaxID=82 RepID=UPI00356AA685